MIRILFYIYIVLSVSMLILDLCFKVLSQEQREISFHTVLVLNVIFSFIYKTKGKLTQ